MKKKIKKIILIVFLVILLAAIIYAAPKIIQIYHFKQEAEYLVKTSSEETFKQTKTTLVYDKNGDELCKIKNDKELYYISYSDIPINLANAFIVMEDREFYTHSGIDYKAIVRAMLENHKNNKIVQGASTITQQLARNIFLSQEVTWERKIKEMFVAYSLEKKYSKEKILEYYLNNIYFGNGFYGVESAAEGYFNKSASELTLSEQAFIAAIPNGPTKYNPFVHFDDTLERRNVILSELYKEGFISSMDYYSALYDEVVLEAKSSSEVDSSIVTYVRHCAVESLMGSMDFVFRNNFEDETDLTNYQNLYEKYYNDCQQKLISGGFTIYTSIDVEKQALLQEIVDKNLESFTEVSDEGVYKMQGAATCIDNFSGNVVAIVGSRSQEDIGGLTLNRAYQSYRQSGSAIKPISVYAPYLQLGHNADSIVEDTPIPDGPVNADGTYSGQMTVRDAVKYSKNTVAWKIYQEITPRVGIGFLMKMGFKKVWYDKDYNAAALGGFTYGVTTEEMAGAYATLANDGEYRKTTCIEKIINASGNELIDSNKIKANIYSASAARMMTDILQSVLEPDGTGPEAAIEGLAIAGKTGSTNSNKDMWFCGYSPYYTLAVWMGYDYPQVIHSNNKATLIFRDYMEQVHKTLPPMNFNKNFEAKDENTTPTQEETSQDDELQEETSQDDTLQGETLQEDTTSQTRENNEQSATGQNTPSFPQRTTPSHEGGFNQDSDMDASGVHGGDVDAPSGNLGGDVDAPIGDTDIPVENLGGDVDAL